MNERMVATNPTTQTWYDVFAKFYDAALDGVYREHRIRTLAQMQIEPGMTVVDVGCGTGAMFPYLLSAVGPEGHVIGADASSGMLKQAGALVRRRKWANVELVDVGTQGRRIEDLRAQERRIDRVVAFLSLSVIDPWQDVLDLWFEALDAGGSLTIADVHNPKPGPYARLVELISRGTLTRESWTRLERKSDDFQFEWQPSSWMLGGRFYCATGRKRSSYSSP